MEVFKVSDYPQEPVPVDGAILDAPKRLLPFLARQTDYRFASARVPPLIGS